MTSPATSTPERLPGAPWLWFDLDDTLYNFQACSLRVLHNVYAQYGLQRFWPTVQEWIDHYHEVNHSLWLQYEQGTIDSASLRVQRFSLPLQARGVSANEATALAQTMDPDYLTQLGQIGLLVSGAREVLQRMRPTHNIGILSNGFRQVQHAKLHSSNIAHLVDCVVLSDDAGCGKPAPGIFRYAEHAAGTTAHRCLMIGDNPDTDIAGALQAGWQAILYRPTPLPRANPLPVPVVTDLAQITPSDSPKTGVLGVNIKKSI